jgi:ketosteroid isomerase-like protein
VSQENVAVTHRLNDAFRRGDWDAVAAEMDPDIFVRSDPRWPEQRFCDRETFLAFLRGTREVLGSELRIEEIVDLGDRVLTRYTWHVRGQHSGIPGDFSFSSITTYREGRSVFTEFFIDHAEALKAVGLSG